MAKKAIYRGSTFNVVNEDETYVTLEGLGYKKRHLKDEVVFLEEPKDEIIDEYPEEPLHNEIQPEELPSEREDKGFIKEEEIISTEIARLQSQKADLMNKEAALNTKLAKAKERAAKEKESMMEDDKETTMSNDEWNKYDEFNVDVDPESHEETRDENHSRFNDSIVSIKEKIHSILEELDGVISKDDYANDQIHYDDERETDDVNYNDLDNHYSNLEVDDETDFNNVMESEFSNDLLTMLHDRGISVDNKEDGYYWMIEKGNLEDLINEFGPFETHDEAIQNALETLEIEPNEINEEGVASVAGPGCSDGTNNQAISAEQGIAIVPSRMGMDRRRELNENELFKFNGKLVLSESRVSNINRHLIADKVEEQYNPMNESEGCSIHKRRKARMESIGRFASLRECAHFIAENQFSCDKCCYEKREQPLDYDEVIREMKKYSNKMTRKIKNI